MKHLIDVKDSRNTERLLGRLRFRPTTEVREGMVVHHDFFPPINPGDSRALTRLPSYEDIIRVTFEVAYRSENNGLLRVAELRTDAPLGVLMMMFGFVLPAETDTEANDRRCRSLSDDRYGLV